MAETVPRFDYRIVYGVAEETGRDREAREDAHLADPELALFAVADGMGGHAAGEVAARLAVEEARRSIASRVSRAAVAAYDREPSLEARRRVLSRLRRAIEHANERVRAEALDDPARAGMGTTLDLIWLARDHAFVAHAGDGRVYLARSRAVLQLTNDHAEVDSLRASGRLGPHGRVRSSGRLLNAVGLADTVTVDTLFVDVSSGDRLLLCSDGVHGQVGGEARLGELLRSGTAQAAARALVAEAAARGHDDVTALVIEIADRFVTRTNQDRGFRARDLERAQQSSLLADLPQSAVMAALAAAVEIEVEAGAVIPQVVARDLVAYIVLDGLVRVDGSRTVSTGALLFPESLVGVTAAGELPITLETARLSRLRADDFGEVCAGDRNLAVELYRRLATHLARSRQRSARSDRAGPGSIEGGGEGE